jgi:hypothetical protein
MARKTVQTKFLSGNIARVDLAPLKGALLPPTGRDTGIYRHRPRNYSPNFSRAPSTATNFESRVPEISGGGETRGTGLGAPTRPPWVRLGVNRPAGGGGPSRGALVVHLAGHAQHGRA